jgi:ketosteroid isomerase-like protein
MSQENVEVVSRFVRQLMVNFSDHQNDPRPQAARLRRGEFDAGSRLAFDLLQPDANWTTRLGEVYEGRLSCAQFAAQILEAWDDYSLSLREVTDLGGDRVLAEYEVQMRGASSGIAGRSAIFGIFTLRDGLIARVAEVSTRAEAVEAVGLAEWAMSQKNVEIVRSLQEAFVGAEPERALALLDPSVEFDTRARPDGKVWRGREGVRRAMVDWGEVWDEWEIETEGYLEAGAGNVLLLWHERARGKESGLTMDLRGANLFTIRDGKVVHIRVYTNQREALKAVGLEE